MKEEDFVTLLCSLTVKKSLEVIIALPFNIQESAKGSAQIRKLRS